MLADSAYETFKDYMCTPFPVTTDNPRELNFNKMFVPSRNHVESTYGFWKGKFLCCSVEGGGIRLQSPKQAAKLVQVCGGLWNKCLAENEPVFEYEAAPVLGEDMHDPPPPPIVPPNGRTPAIPTNQIIMDLYMPAT